MTTDERELRLKAAEELELIARRIAAANNPSRFLSIVLTKIEEAALWYAKLLKEEEEPTTNGN